MKDKTLQNARHDWVLAEIKKMKLANPVNEISDKLGVLKSTVSMILNRKQGLSMNFFNSFCEAYGFNAEAVNHLIIEQVKNGIVLEQLLNEDEPQYGQENMSNKLDSDALKLLSSIPQNETDMLRQQNFLLATTLANLSETNKAMAQGLLKMIEGASKEGDKEQRYPKRNVA